MTGQFDPSLPGAERDSDIFVAQDSVASFLEVTSGLLVPVPEGMRVITSCSDDRFPTEESVGQIDDRYEGTSVMAVEDGYARYWGGSNGLAAGSLIAACMLKGEAGITENGGYDATVNAIDQATDNRMARHSDVKSEGNPVSLCAHGKLGCLLCEALGAALVLLATDETVQDTARTDIHNLGLDSKTERFDPFITGVRLLSESLVSNTKQDPATFHISREQIASDIEDGMNFMVLQGSHAPAQENRAILNFLPDTVSNPRAAWEAGEPFYGVDATVVGDQIGALVGERDMLRWEDYIVATSGLTTAVRAALVANDANKSLIGKFDPRPLAVGRVGSPVKAIEYLADRWSK